MDVPQLPAPDAADPNNGSLQEMMSDPSMETAENEDDDHAFETATYALLGLREISGLGTWTVSTHKPHCGAAALLNPTPSTFWQSDGPQPHLLTAHFPRTITILQLRVFLDFTLDESYTPTKIEFFGGVHGADYGLVQFGAWSGEEPRGWQEVALDGQGPGGQACVRVRVLQVRVSENHQNGKDTHVRGIQVFAKDERVKAPVPATEQDDAFHSKNGGGTGPNNDMERLYISEEPDWMGDPQIR